MKMPEMMDEIKELNLTYLMLAQHMIREDKDAAIYRLGVSQQLADVLADLTAAQVLKMAGANMLLCRMRFDDRLILGLLTSHGKEGTMPQSHAAILLSGQPVEELA
ncbi:MAG: flagellar transcriptional regulator FlhD [Burkholderiales bacterium]|jgi:flagellar transcriptional activator FlhD